MKAIKEFFLIEIKEKGTANKSALLIPAQHHTETVFVIIKVMLKCVSVRNQNWDSVLLVIVYPIVHDWK